MRSRWATLACSGLVAVACSSSGEPVERAVRQFDVDGIEVIAETTSTDLPQVAGVVEFTDTIIDDGSGPELCLGAVEESLPPQCDGPVIKGLDMSGWSDELDGVRWGERTVTVTWPPEAGSVDFVAQAPGTVAPRHRPALPVECESIDDPVLASGLSSLQPHLGDLYAGVWLTEDDLGVLQVTGDVSEQLEPLERSGRVACVIEVEHNRATLLRFQTQVHLQAGSQAHVISLTPNGAYGRVDVVVAVPDRRTVDAIAGTGVDPTAVRVIGWGAILEPAADA